MNSRKTAYGNTVTGTYELILDRLDFDDRRYTLLDVPCGTGIFLDRVRELFPTVDTHGWDIAPPSTVTHKFSTVDLDRPETIRSQKMFDVITCISGVMEFSNTLAFFRSIAQILAETGTLFVTNDNLLTVRDRFLYLLSGRFRQYRLSLPLDAPTWKPVSLSVLTRILWDSGFEIDELQYVPPKRKEWLWLPLAVVLYCFQRMTAGTRDLNSGREVLPFISFISRHYVLTCRRRIPTSRELHSRYPS